MESKQESGLLSERLGPMYSNRWIVVQCHDGLVRIISILFGYKKTESVKPELGSAWLEK